MASEADAGDNKEMANSPLKPEVSARMIELMRAQCTAKQWGEWLRAPVHLAAATGNAELTEELVQAGASGDPISEAIRAGQHDVIRHLQLEPTDHHLQVALDVGNEATVSLLLELGADADPKELPGVRDDVHGSNTQYCAPLHVAAKAGQAGMVGLLMDAGANADRRATMVYSPYLLTESALHLGAIEGHADVITEILKRQPSILGSVAASTHYTALHYAAKHSKLDAIDALVEAGADLGARGGGYSTALQVAVESPDCEATMQALLWHGAEVDQVGALNQTALVTAVKAGNLCAADVLVSAGADVREPLLIAAAQPSSEDMIAALLWRGGDVNATRALNRNTPLHLAAEMALVSNVDALLEAGADETAVNAWGETPLDVIPRRESVIRWIDSDDEEGEEEEDEDVIGVRNLLVHAPRDRADRAWYRRRFFVLCRAFPERVRLQLTPPPADGVNNDARSNASSASEGPSTGRENTKRVATAEGKGDAGGRPAAAGVEEEDATEFRAAMCRMMGLEADVVFRTIVEFL